MCHRRIRIRTNVFGITFRLSWHIDAFGFGLPYALRWSLLRTSPFRLGFPQFGFGMQHLLFLVIFSCVVGLFGCGNLARKIFMVVGFCCQFSIDWVLFWSKGLLNFFFRLRLWCEYYSRPVDLLKQTIRSFDDLSLIHI